MKQNKIFVSISVLTILLTVSFVAEAQRQKIKGRTQSTIDQEESIPVIPTRSEVPERPPVEDRRNIGEFPYRRGETPIFNFDDGDEAFVQTIPDLIEGLHDMTASVVKQRKVTNTYAKVFLDCVDCKP